MKLIKSVGINPRRATLLKEKSIELLIKSQKPIKEVDLVNFLIDELTEKIDIDHHGFFIKENQ